LALFAVAAVVFWTGNRRLDKTMKNVGGGMVLLAVGWALAAYLVQTPRERAVAHTKSLLHAYAAHDWPRFQSLLDPTTTLANYANRDMIVRAAQESIDNPGVKDVYILSTEADQTGTHIAVNTTIVTTVARAMDRPVRSTWQLDFVNMGGTWTLTTITPLAFEGQDPSPILRQLPHVNH
jgi:uncharacterized membrane protein YeiB